MSRGWSHKRSSGADNNRPAPSPPELYLVAGLFPGDPLTGSVRGSAASVEARSVLPAHPGTAMDLAEGPVGIEGCGFLATNPGNHLNTVGTQPLFSPGCHRVGIRLGDDDSRDPGVSQGMATRTCATDVVARLQGDHSGGPPGFVTSLAQGFHLSVRGSRSAVPSLAYHPALGKKDAADTRVRI
mgnify:FL=1